MSPRFVSRKRSWEKKGVSGILKSVATRKEFLESVKHQIRFVFLPKHSSWLNQIETVFGIVMRKVMRRGNFTSVADLEEKIKQFLDYFNRVFAHPSHAGILPIAQFRSKKSVRAIDL